MYKKTLSMQVPVLLAIAMSYPSLADSRVSVANQMSPAKHPVTPEVLLSSINAQVKIGRDSLRWIPKSDSVLIALKENVTEGTWIEEIDVTTGKRKRLVKSEIADPSPDGSKIAYISEQSGSKQIWMIHPDGSGASQVTNISGGIANNYFCWSPDSSKIAYMAAPLSSLQPSRSIPVVKVFSTVVIHNQEDSTSIQSSLPEIWAVTIQTGERRKIAACLANPTGGLSWSLDGKTLYSNQYDESHGKNRMEAVASSVETGESRIIFAKTVADTYGCQPSPNNKVVAFLYSDYHGGYWHDWQLGLTSLQGNFFRHLSTPFKINLLGWSHDGAQIFVSRRDGIDDQILSMNTDGQIGKETTKITGSWALVGSPVLSEDGRFAWVDLDWQGRMLLQIASEKKTQPRTVVDFTPDLDSLSLGDTHVIHWKSHDGVENSGLLVRPVGYMSDRKYPLLVDVHGGPGSGVNAFGLLCMGALEWQMWAARGYAVFIPEYRSSGMYGFDKILQERKSRKCFDGDFDDIMSGVDHLIATGLVDSKRMAVVGHSYGSTETNWIITHTHRFHAAISYEGSADMYADWGVNEYAGRNMQWLLNGTPVTEPQVYLYNSSMYRSGNVTTPTLFITGEHGINSPSMASMFAALKHCGVDTQYLSYQGEGHVVSQPANQRDLVYWCINWVDTHLGYSSTPDPMNVFDVSTAIPSANRVTKR